MNKPSAPDPVVESATPAKQLAELWRRNDKPDVHAFVARFPPLSREELLAVLRIDQAERWRHGEPVQVESYLTSYPDLHGDDEHVLDLIYSEIVLRESLGQAPGLEEYVQRFPRFAAPLQRQFALDRAMGWDSLLQEDKPAGPARIDEAETQQVGAAVPGAAASGGDDTPVLSHPAIDSVVCRAVVPGYVMLEELGRGGMGVVYKAEQVRLKRLVALKMILAGDHAGPQELARFRREAEAVAQLQHSNIVQIYEVGEWDGRPYFSLELVDGGSLAARLNGTPLPSPAAAELLETLARAMDHAHQRGIIHRDLKPANVLLQIADLSEQSAICNLQSAIPKITDFGLAKRLDAVSLATNSGQILGTPSYMAPEQASGKEVGPTADIYALGAILYEVLTGRPPFKAATTLDTVMQVVGVEPVPPRRLQPTVARDLETICLKCLHKDPRRRYASAAALADDLSRFREQKPIRARPASLWVHLVKGIRRRPALAALCASVIVGVVLAYSGVLIHLQRVVDDERATSAALKQAEGNLYLNQIALAAREWSAGNVDRAEQYLDHCSPGLRNWEWHYLKRLCHLELHTFRDAGGFGVAFSPDGRRLASASLRDQAVRILDAATGQVLMNLAHAGPAVAFSPDGRLLASAVLHLGTAGNVEDKPSDVKVWDPATGREVLSLGGVMGHKKAVWAVAFSPDRVHLASAGWDGTVKIWNVQTGQFERLLLHGGRVDSLSYDRTGQRLASAAGDGTIKIWATATGILRWQQRIAVSSNDRGGTGFRAARAEKGESFSKGENTVLKNWDSTRKVWDATCSTEILTARGQTHQVASVAFSPDDRLLAFGAGDTIDVWDVAPTHEWRRILNLRGHTDLVRALAFSPDGKRLASAGYDKSIKVWDMTPGTPSGPVGDMPSGNELFTVRGHTEPVNGLAYRADGQQLASAGWDRTVRVWSAAADRAARNIPAHTKLVRSLAYSPGGQWLASASADKTIQLMDVTGRQSPIILRGHQDLVRSVMFSRDGKWLASASYDKTVKIWDVARAQVVLTYQGHKDRVFAASFSPDGHRVASAGTDGIVKVWDRKTGRDIFSYCGHKGRVHAVAYHPDGRHIASAGDDKMVHVWDADTGAEVFVLKGHQRDIMAVAYSPDGRLLASASLDRTIRLWDADTGREIATLDGHTEAVIGLAFSPDSTRLASGSMDRTIKLWEPATGQEALTLRGSMREIFSVAFSPDGHHLAAGNTDGTVRIWDGGS